MYAKQTITYPMEKTTAILKKAKREVGHPSPWKHVLFHPLHPFAGPSASFHDCVRTRFAGIWRFFLCTWV